MSNCVILTDHRTSPCSDFDRQFYRVTLVGDVPVGVDGKSSTPVEGNPIVAV